MAESAEHQVVFSYDNLQLVLRDGGRSVTTEIMCFFSSSSRPSAASYSYDRIQQWAADNLAYMNRPVLSFGRSNEIIRSDADLRKWLARIGTQPSLLEFHDNLFTIYIDAREESPNLETRGAGVIDLTLEDGDGPDIMGKVSS